MTNTEDATGAATTFGERLKAIRGFLRLSREAFAVRHGIPAATLKTWELSQVGISNAHMNKLLNALAKEKIPCSAEWLLEGRGASPFSISTVDHEKSAFSGIYAERECFLKNNAHSLVQMVPDNAMYPYFYKGDYVGGVKIDIHHQMDAHKAFIVYMKNKPEPLIRFIQKDASGQFILIHANLNELGYNFIIHPEIQEVYQIIWHRSAI